MSVPNKHRDFAREIKAAAEETPFMAVWAVHELYMLGLDDYAVQASWPKLADRPAGVVKAFVANLEGEKPEMMQHHIGEFAKHVKPVSEAEVE